jgi:Xaa-Pro aminopeptidase
MLEKTQTKMNVLPPLAHRLEKLRELMKQYSLNALIISSRDDFLNEYVDKQTSKRIYYSGFTGTAGDLFITLDEAYLIVDGRYHIQAEQQVDKQLYTVEKVGLNEKGERITEFIADRHIKIVERLSSGKNLVIGYDPNQFSVKTIRYIRDKISEVSKTAVLTALTETFLDKISIDFEQQMIKPVFTVPVEISGKTTLEKISIIKKMMLEKNLNALFITKLDELAYLTNLRSAEIDYNSTFKGYGFITNKDAFVFADPKKFSCQCLRQANAGYDVIDIKDMFETLSAYIGRQQNKFHIGFDPATTTCAIQDKLNMLVNKNCKLIELDQSPIKELKAIKNDQELKYIKECLQKADNVFQILVQEVQESVAQGLQVTEKDIKDKITALFYRYGADCLSFEVISAIGKNAAIVHYTAASDKAVAAKNQYILVDSGAYFKGGYATDLTRTFLAGGKSVVPDQKLKEIYTIVLKASLNGLSAELPPDSDGNYLDDLVRSVVREYGYDYNHGTGHGIGILVHEAPPTIIFGPSGSNILKENMVFSIEPGIYLQDWGGVRIENIVTLKQHPEHSKAMQGWLKVSCLTFAPLDENLILYEMLDGKQKAYLDYYKSQFVKCEPVNK